jgi:hypothetical protein
MWPWNTWFWWLGWACKPSLEQQAVDLVTAWKTDPAGLSLQLEQEQDPLKKLHQITLLSEHLPGQTQALCSLLDSETDKDRCIQLNARPHLWASQTPKATQKNTEEPAEAIDSSCPKDAIFHSCVTQQAQDAAQRGQLSLTHGLCLGIDSSTWRSECLFSAAESMVLQRGAHGYGQSVQLCLVAEDFAENCLQHLIMLLAQTAPNANTSASTSWEPIVQAERAIQTSWSWRDPQRAKQDSERLWSEAIALSFSAARPVGGAPLDILPKDKHPFIHAAVVRKLMELESPNQHSLDEWVQLTLTVLNQRHSQSKTRAPVPPRADYADLWDNNSTHPSIPLMATSRREYADIQEADIAICILETAARLPPISSELFEAATTSKYPAVVRTTLRLQAKLQDLPL